MCKHKQEMQISKKILHWFLEALQGPQVETKCIRRWISERQSIDKIEFKAQVVISRCYFVASMKENNSNGMKTPSCVLVK